MDGATRVGGQMQLTVSSGVVPAVQTRPYAREEGEGVMCFARGKVASCSHGEFWCKRTTDL